MRLRYINVLNKRFRPGLGKDFFRSLGLVLVFTGMQFNTGLKNVFPGLDLSVPIMLLSVLFLIDFKNIGNIRIPAGMTVMFGLQLFFLINAVFSGFGTVQLITFHLYLLALIFALSTNLHFLKFESFGRILFWISGFIAIVILNQATEGFSRLVRSFQNTGKLWLAQGGDPITMSRILVINLIAVLFYNPQNPIEKICGFVFLIADVIGLFSFSNRLSILCSMMITVIWYFKYFSVHDKAQKILFTIAGLIVVLFLIINIPYFRNTIKNLYRSFINGVGTLLRVGTVRADSSARLRVKILEDLSVQFFDANILQNLLVGQGYNHIYVDRPMIQIFFDFGLIVFSIYVYLLIWIPAKTVIRQLKSKDIYNGAWIYVVYISVQAVFDQTLVGLPYYYSLWTPSIFILFSISNYRQAKKQGIRFYEVNYNYADNRTHHAIR